jgi:squalene cyclase
MLVASASMPSLTDAQKKTIQEVADHMLTKQRADGAWEFYLSRPPINESETTDNAWLIMALEAATTADSPEPQRTALAKAHAWWESVKLPDTQQDKAFKVILGVRAGKPRSELQPTIDELLALQHPDGGWAQLPNTPSDAYATAQTLYALALAGDGVDAPHMAKAIAFLTSTQQPDGSWLMTSRSSPDGSTGGSAKLLTPITCGAASWATLALSTLVPGK